MSSRVNRGVEEFCRRNGFHEMQISMTKARVFNIFNWNPYRSQPWNLALNSRDPKSDENMRKCQRLAIVHLSYHNRHNASECGSAYRESSKLVEHIRRTHIRKVMLIRLPSSSMCLVLPGKLMISKFDNNMRKSSLANYGSCTVQVRIKYSIFGTITQRNGLLLHLTKYLTICR